MAGRLDRAAAYALKECRNIENLRLSALDNGSTTISHKANNSTFVWFALRELILANKRLR